MLTVKNEKNENEDFQFRFQGMVHKAAKMSKKLRPLVHNALLKSHVGCVIVMHSCSGKRAPPEPAQPSGAREGVHRERRSASHRLLQTHGQRQQRQHLARRVRRRPHCESRDVTLARDVIPMFTFVVCRMRTSF